jgi:signal transduction histidine kinase
MLEAMDDIVWAVNPRNDHFNDLAVRIREFCIPLLEAKNIRFDIDINENILTTRLRMETRKNIFLVFKECVNNLLKHSGCTEMQVVVKKSDNYLEVIISDNGRGFDISAPTNRNGLKNMQKRAAEINGVLQLTTKPGAGVTTRLVIDMI